MEDRLTPGLYLECSTLDAAEYAATRIDTALALPHVTRATWWSNAYPNRPDLPRRLPEFATLGVYELDDANAFAPPATPDGTLGLHFARTPRPGQGQMYGRRTVGLSVVLISPKDPARAQELRDWGDFVHISYIASVGIPGFTMITPYENTSGGEPRFLHFYEFDDADAGSEATFKRMTPLIAERYGAPGTPTYDSWAWHPQLRIEYVNSFDLVGERTP
ncbi:MAG: hypothetical protein ACOYNI_11750 [Acidimicrobiia bacterium]